jgi:hypothetical protein
MALLGGSYVIGGVPLKGILGCFPSLSLLPGCHEQSSLALPCAVTMMFCLTTGPKATAPSNYGLKPLKPQSKLNLFLLLSYFEYFVTAKETNTALFFSTFLNI